MPETQSDIDYDRLPEVSFDVRLGKRLKTIDFNYVDYIDHLHDQGLGQADIENTKVHIRNSRGLEVVGIAPQGWYNADNQVVHVKALRPLSPKLINKRLLHETSHRIDHALGTHASLKLNVVGNLGVIAGNALVFGCYIPLGLHEINNNQAARDVGEIMLSAGLTTLLASSGFRHFIHPDERRAYSAQKQQKQFISIIKK